MKNFAIYRSSAGSGKTFSLVREYLRIALGDPASPPQQYREILAITFTNKAASEMKERILRYLRDLSRLEDDDHSVIAVQLMKLLDVDRHTLRARAVAVLHAILHNYSEFAVGTIDAFTHRIVRAFAFDLQLPSNFEVETDEDNLIEQAVDLLVSKIGEDDELTSLLVNYSESKTDEEKSWQPEREIRSISKQLLKEKGGAFAEKLGALSISDFKKIREKLLAYIRGIDERVVAECNALLSFVNEAGVNGEEITGGPKGIHGFIRKCSNNPGAIFDLPEKLETAGKNKNLFSGKVPKARQEHVTGIAREFIGKCELMAEWTVKERSRYIIRRNILRNIYALSVLNEVKKIIHGFRETDHIIHISEFNRMISEIVFSEPVPFIYERLGEKFKNYLVDEFQDTSVMQWQNLLPLIDNSLATGHFTMIVGDGKQAIYRWRNGDVEQFVALPQIIHNTDNPLVQQRASSLDRNHEVVPLDNNFRSCREIVEFNNEFFRHCTNFLHPDHQRIYDGLKQNTAPDKTGGYIEISVYADESADPLETCVQKIKILIEEGWQPSEIAVLTRSNKEVSVIVNSLLGHSIPVLASEYLLIRNSPAVRFLICILHDLEYAHGTIPAGSGVCWLVAENKVDGDLDENLRLLHDCGFDLITFLNRKGHPLDRNELLQRNLFDRTHLLASFFGLLDHADAFVVFFLDEVLHFMNSRQSLRVDFFDWWQDRCEKASVMIPEGTNAVSVMTIHKAKGLEFPVVFMPYADWKMKDKLAEMWVEHQDELVPELKAILIRPSKELEGTALEDLRDEELDRMKLDLVNELYVAMTRPVQRLYLSVSSGKLSGEGEIRGAGDVVMRVIEKMNLSCDDGIYRVGKEVASVSKPEIQSGKIPITTATGNDWEQRIRIRSAAKEMWDEGSALVSGKVIHYLLSKIRKSSDLQKVIGDAVSEGLISIDDRPEIESHLQRVINAPSLASLFSETNSIFSEREILLKDGKLMRPDLVIIGNDGVTVLDYKTGKKEREHQQQVEEYAGVLEEMGYAPVRRKLFYTLTGECLDW